MDRIIDSHVHLRNLESVDQLEGIRRYIGVERMNIVCNFGREMVNANPAAFVAKAKYPDNFYIFTGLDHSAYFSDGRISAPSLREQVDRLIAIGADGIKMLENKPTHRRMLDIPVDGEYFEDYFAHMEEIGIPIVWHVADPEEFWDPATTPKWAAEKGWGYDETFTLKEQLYAEVENVLERHPGLRICFSHFFFLSADLPRAARLLDRFPDVHLDLTPGIELLHNLSKNRAETRSFFLRYSDRILFGTDCSNAQTPDECRARAGIVIRWLETSDEYRVPPEADFLLGSPEDGIMRGLSLPEDVLRKICRTNFERFAGSEPRKLNIALAAEECERISMEAAVFLSVNPEITEAGQADGMLHAMQ